MRTLMWIALLACAGRPAGYAQATPDAEAESKIVAMEHIWSQSYVLKDPRALERILDDAFVNVESDGKVITKADVLAEVKTSKVLQVLTESMAVHLHGDTAIVTGIIAVRGMDRGKPFEQRDRFVDTWLYKNAQWVTIAGMVTQIGK